MKYNDSDMDDLFRRASERYPLRTDSADWDRLAGAMGAEPAAPSDEKEERRRRGVFWWFLLIPLAGIGYWTWQVKVDHPAKVAKVQTRKDGGGSRGVVGTEAGRTASAASGGGTTNRGAVGVTGKVGTADNAATGAVGNLRLGGEAVAGRHTGNRRNAADVDRRDLTEGSENAGQASGERRRKVKGAAGGTVVSSDNDAVLALLDLRRAPIAGRYGVDVDVVAPTVKADSRTPDDKKAVRHPHTYIGISGAPDFSTVRFQSMKGVGATFGLMLGYAFNDRWAVESGLYLDRKRYYTEGEYFSTKNVWMPPYSKLLNVDGTCYMWEIPVNVRYNFNTSPRMKWFATAGLSTYLMSKENYTYQYESTWGTGDSSWNIQKPSQYWFTIVNLSAGFEQRIGKLGSLRLEPYARIPLSGIGTGNLHIVSAGLNIGLVRRLW